MYEISEPVKFYSLFTCPHLLVTVLYIQIKKNEKQSLVRGMYAPEEKGLFLI